MTAHACRDPVLRARQGACCYQVAGVPNKADGDVGFSYRQNGRGRLSPNAVDKSGGWHLAGVLGPCPISKIDALHKYWAPRLQWYCSIQAARLSTICTPEAAKYSPLLVALTWAFYWQQLLDDGGWSRKRREQGVSAGWHPQHGWPEPRLAQGFQARKRSFAAGKKGREIIRALVNGGRQLPSTERAAGTMRSRLMRPDSLP